VAEGIRREGGSERGGRKKRGLLPQKGGQLPQEAAGKCDIVENATLR
jgi:hypothetical protein